MSLFFFRIVFLIIFVFVWVECWEIGFWLLLVFFMLNLVIFSFELFFKFFVIKCFCWMEIGIWIFDIIVLILLLLFCFFFVFSIILLGGEMSGCFVEVIRVYRVLIDERWVVLLRWKLLEWKVFMVVYMILGFVLFVLFL